MSNEAKVKEITISPELKEEITRLSKQLHALCVANNIPFVLGLVTGKQETKDGINVCKLVSSFYDSRTGAFDSTIVAARKILGQKQVPASFIYLLQQMCDEDDDAEQNDIIH